MADFAGHTTTTVACGQVMQVGVRETLELIGQIHNFVRREEKTEEFDQGVDRKWRLIEVVRSKVDWKGMVDRVSCLVHSHVGQLLKVQSILISSTISGTAACVDG